MEKEKCIFEAIHSRKKLQYFKKLIQKILKNKDLNNNSLGSINQELQYSEYLNY